MPPWWCNYGDLLAQIKSEYAQEKKTMKFYNVYTFISYQKVQTDMAAIEWCGWKVVTLGRRLG